MTLTQDESSTTLETIMMKLSSASQAICSKRRRLNDSREERRAGKVRKRAAISE